MYLCSENKGADQLSSYRAADLRLCFSRMQNQVLSFYAMELIPVHM